MPRKKKVDIEERRCLTEAEMLKINKATLEKKITDLEVKVLEQKRVELELRKQLLDAESKTLSNSIIKLKDDSVKKLETHKKFVKSLVKELELKNEKFGYNPDTGEIVD